MNKFMMSVLLAASVACAYAQAPANPVPGRRGGERPQHQLTPEQRQARRERAVAQRKERQETARKNVVAMLVEAGLDEEKAKAVAEKIEKFYFPHPFPNPMAGGHRRPRPEAK